MDRLELASKPLTHAELGTPVKVSGSHGDTWSSTWAADGNTYTLSCDCKGLHDGCMPHGSNLAFNRLIGNPSDPGNLDGVVVNPMKTHPGNFGTWAETKYDNDGVLRMWKANGLAGIDGVLYMTVSRHAAMNEHTQYIQDAINASILKSINGGADWTPAEHWAYTKPMFPGKKFSTPFFVQYGKDGRIPADNGEWHLPPHNGDRFVYAVSADGYWNNGSHMKLARVERSRLPHLDAADWQFFKGSCTDESAGYADACWSSNADEAVMLIHNPGQIGEAGVQYLWPLRRYVMLQWYYPKPYTSTFDTTRTVWQFYESPTPWGPWTRFHEAEFNGNGGFYNPDIISASITWDSARKACNMTLLTAGDWKTCNDPDGVYAMHAINLTLY